MKIKNKYCIITRLLQAKIRIFRQHQTQMQSRTSSVIRKIKVTKHVYILVPKLFLSDNKVLFVFETSHISTQSVKNIQNILILTFFK